MATSTDIAALQTLFTQLGTTLTDAIALKQNGFGLSSFEEIMQVYSDVSALAVDAKPAMAEIPSLSVSDYVVLSSSALELVQQVVAALAK